MTDTNTNKLPAIPTDEVSQAFSGIAEVMVYIKEIAEGAHNIDGGEIHRLYNAIGAIEKLAEHTGAVADNMAKKLEGAQWRGGLESWAMPYLTQNVAH